MNSAHIQLLKENYANACNAYVKAMLESFEVDRENCWWVGDEVGGVFMVGDMLSLNMQDIVYIVDNGISYDECVDWQDYNLRANEFNFNMLNINSWHKGAPRVPQETFDKLRKMKDELKSLCEETKSKY
jgi:hypothetical protein